MPQMTTKEIVEKIENYAKDLLEVNKQFVELNVKVNENLKIIDKKLGNGTFKEECWLFMKKMFFWISVISGVIFLTRILGIPLGDFLHKQIYVTLSILPYLLFKKFY